jgi:NAD(P)-dependent dehydrogenase (short-subunit alcohol dehydrogenase family)
LIAARHARGDRVAGTVRDLSVMDCLRADHRDRLWLAALDLSETASIRGVVDRAWTALGRIDVVVSNAGYGLMGAAEELTDEQVSHQIDTNLVGSIQLVRAALPHLRAQGGRILQLSSMGGQVAFPGRFALSRDLAAHGPTSDIAVPNLPPNSMPEVSPSRMVNRILADASQPSPGDPARMVEIMISSVDQGPAPGRIALGSDTYLVMHAQLSARLAALEAQRDLAFSTDFPAESGAGTAAPWFAAAEPQSDSGRSR